MLFNSFVRWELEIRWKFSPNRYGRRNVFLRDNFRGELINSLGLSLYTKAPLRGGMH